MKFRSVLIGLAIVLLLFASLGVLIALLAHVTFLKGPIGANGQSALNQWLVLIAATVSVALFCVLVIIGVDDQLRRDRLSPLYWPFLATKGILAAFLTIASVTAIDFLSHGANNLQWTWIFDPEVRVLVSLLFLGLAVALGWQLWVIFRGRVIERRSQ